MVDEEVSFENAFETTLTAEFGPTDLTASVVTKGTLTTPTILVIEPDDDAQREYVRFNGVFGASSFVTTNVSFRYLVGSAAPSGLTHPSGAIVRQVATGQAYEDLHDRIDAHDTKAAHDALNIDADTLDGLDSLAFVEGTDHTTAQHDALGIEAADSLLLQGLNRAGFVEEAEHDLPAHEALGIHPAGAIIMFGAAAAPTDWVLCQGQAINRTTFADLFAVIGTTFGVGDGSTTFNVPDLKERVPVGADTGDYDLGDTGGEETHVLVIAEVAAHTHTGVSHSHSPGSLATSSSGSHGHDLNVRNAPETSVTHGHTNFNSRIASASGAVGTDITNTTASIDTGNHTHPITGVVSPGGTGAGGSAGSNAAHENRPPFLALHFIIKT